MKDTEESSPLPIGGKFTHQDIEVERRDDALVMQNSRIRRVLDLQHALPRTISLTDRKTGCEHVMSDKRECDFSFMGYNMPTSKFKTEYILDAIEVMSQSVSFFDGELVLVRLIIREDVQKLQFMREYFLYPRLGVMSARSGIRSESSPNLYWSKRGTLWENERYGPEFKENCVDSLKLAPELNHIRVVEFIGRTDYTNDLIREQKCGNTDFSARGNLLFATNTDENSGLFLLQEAPPSTERRDVEKEDFRLAVGEIHSLCWGVGPHEVDSKHMRYSYRTTVGVFGADDAVGGKRLLKKYLATRFPQNIKKDFDVLVNPWGCGSFNEDLSESFLIREIKAAGEIGATHYQIDDGWQIGRSLGELIHNNRAVDERFWEISHAHLPGGLERLHAEAKAAKVELALWIAPSSNREFRDWEAFVALMHDFYRKFGIRRFKIDGIIIRTKEAEENLEKLVRALRVKSNGDILFNFDVTNGQRAGYFLFLEYGNLFLENRYACHEWGMVYHPGQVLSNLWTLSSYIRPQILQIEVTDPLRINRKYYDQNGMEYPDAYPLAYWAAVTLFANPLLWFAPSRLPDEMKAIYRVVMSLHRKYHEEIFAGEIFPVGQKPSGSSLTGFQSHNDEQNRGFLIVYRELEAPESGIIDLHFVQDDVLVLTSLSDDTPQIRKTAGEPGVEIMMKTATSFRLYRYESISQAAQKEVIS